LGKKNKKKPTKKTNKKIKLHFVCVILPETAAAAKIRRAVAAKSAKELRSWSCFPTHHPLCDKNLPK